MLGTWCQRCYLLAVVLPLPFAYNIKNTVQLMDELIEMPQGQYMKFVSFDTSSLYSNILTGN